LRSLNRLNDLVPGLQVSGNVLLHGQNIYAADADVNAIRSRIGMLFQQPVVFPESIAENVLFGAKRLRSLSRGDREALVESALREAALWEEVRDRLNRSATTLSVGQQQRLCLARALAVGPEVLLMDEPTSALDPRSTAAIEELVLRLKERLAIVIVTHNLSQARRVSDRLACLCVRDGVGQIIEQGTADAMLCCAQTTELAEYMEHAQ
ncbi:MAG: phosphate ABC transporter ATP-binding protein, partial [Chthoniobacteraceae bacterium]